MKNSQTIDLIGKVELVALQRVAPRSSTFSVLGSSASTRIHHIIDRRRALEKARRFLSYDED